MMYCPATKQECDRKCIGSQCLRLPVTNPEINPEIKCVASKITGAGDSIPCRFEAHHRGTHSFERGDNNPGDYETVINPEINPQHYHGDKVMQFIEEFDLGFCEGNAVKYIARHKSKGIPLIDLKKAMWYLERAISNLETEKL